jgi:hypothetical protein
MTRGEREKNSELYPLKAFHRVLRGDSSGNPQRERCDSLKSITVRKQKLKGKKMNFNIISVQYIGATNHRSSKVKMKSHRFGDSKTINYDHRFRDTLEIAENYLKKNGFQIIGHGEDRGNGYYIITNTFKPMKETSLPRQTDINEFLEEKENV